MHNKRLNPWLARKMEIRYGQQLRKISTYINTIIRGFDVNDPRTHPLIVASLNQYANTLHWWAQNTAGRIITDVALRDEKTWMIYAEDLSRGMRDQIRNTDIGAVYQQMLDQQVGLIKSLPLEAAQRVHQLSTEALIGGGRPKELVEMILNSGDVSKGGGFKRKCVIK